MQNPEYDFTLEMWYLKIDMLKHIFYGYFDTEQEAKSFKKRYEKENKNNNNGSCL